MASVRIEEFDFRGLTVIRLHSTVQGDITRRKKTIERRQIPHEIQEEAENLIKERDPQSHAKAERMGGNNEIFVDQRTGKIWLRGVRKGSGSVRTNIDAKDLPDHVREAVPPKKFGFLSASHPVEVLCRIAASTMSHMGGGRDLSECFDALSRQMTEPRDRQNQGPFKVVRSSDLEEEMHRYAFSFPWMLDREFLKQFDNHFLLLQQSEETIYFVQAAEHEGEVIMTIATPLV